MTEGVGITEPTRWTLDHIRQHIEEGLPLVPLFNLEVMAAEADRAVLRLAEGRHVTRPGGSVAGPVQFALADVATYALILAARHDLGR
jgi:acyl-coenzyme A thioesterase PaaI-like protein